jgi:hypothetical protein
MPCLLALPAPQTAAVAPLLKELYSGTSLGKAGCVLTIHNIA